MSTCDMASSKSQPVSSELDDDNNEDEDDDDDDSELPIVNRTPQKVKEFEENSIVWCKWRNDYWPAYVKKVYKRQKKMTVVFADRPCDDGGQENKFTFPFNRIVKFDNSARSKDLLLAGSNGCQELKDAIKKARDFIVTRGLGHLHVSPIKFLNNPIDNVMAEFCAENNGKNSAKRQILNDESDETTAKKQFVNRDETSEENELSDEAAKELDSTDTDERSDEAKAFSESIIKAIQTSDCLEFLVKIHEGVIESDRHNWFKNGTATDRRRLKHIKFHHIMTARQLEPMLLFLRKELEKHSSVSRLHIMDYSLDVWLPEALIYGVQMVLNVTRQRAEASLLTGELPRP